MVFVSFGRPDEVVTEAGIYRRGDLYVSERVDSVWQPTSGTSPEPINSPAAERAPSVSPDGKHFYFMSARGFATRHPPQPISIDQLEKGLHSSANGLGNIFEADIGALHLHGPPDSTTAPSSAQTSRHLCIHHLPEWLASRVPWAVAGCSRAATIAPAPQESEHVRGMRTVWLLLREAA